jgi:bifunctional non-homologous end joining protein LigD
MWPEEGITKQGLADFYQEIWNFIGPQIVGRPLRLVRCPSGIGGQSFFQKRSFAGLSNAVTRLTDPKTQEELLAITDIEGLIALVQGSAVEIHLWNAAVDRLDRPDRIIFDLDPGPGVSWSEICDAALEVRDHLANAQLASFIKTSGSKGLHVVAPIPPTDKWDTKQFARELAETMAKRRPALYTAEASHRLRPGKIYIDYLRHARGATTIAPYSTRARPSAPVSTPIGWEELTAEMSSERFRVRTILNRLQNLTPDPWARFFEANRSVAKSLRTRADRR